MKNRGTKEIQRKRRHRRIRKKVRGTEERPRLVVRRSLNNIYVQVVDDEAGRILTSLSTLSKEVKEQSERETKTQIAHTVGVLFGKKCRDSKIESVVFDRAGYKYHGRVKALALGAREGGLKF